jgi:hypothetical protein
MRRIFIYFLFLAPLSLKSQVFTTVETQWNDSFVAWNLYSTEPADSTEPEPEELLSGEFKLRWLPMREDWTEWEYQLGTERGTIRQRWKNDKTQWELRGYNGQVISVRSIWGPNDLTEWRVSDNNIALELRSRWKNQLDEWTVKDQRYGSFYLYTLRQQDTRAWAINDDLKATVSPEMKLALVFLTVFHSSPRL